MGFGGEDSLLINPLLALYEPRVEDLEVDGWAAEGCEA